MIVKGYALRTGDILRLPDTCPIRLLHGFQKSQHRYLLTWDVLLLLPSGSERPHQIVIAPGADYPIERPAAVGALTVEREYLAPGDEFSFQRVLPGQIIHTRAVIVEIGTTEIIRRSGTKGRRAICRDLNAGDTFERNFVGHNHLITGGPKLAAADANPALVKRVSGPNCLLWIGDQIEARQL